MILGNFLKKTDKRYHFFIYFNIFITFLIIGFIFSDIAVTLKYYYFYFPIIGNIIGISFSGLFLGSILSFLLGRISYIRRIIFVLFEFIFTIIVSGYLLRGLFFKGIEEPLLLFLEYSNIYAFLIIFFLFFIIAFKIQYFIKIIISNKNSEKIVHLIIFLLSGMIIGVFTGSINVIYSEFKFILDERFLVLILFFIIILPLFIKEKFDVIKKSDDKIGLRKKSISFIFYNLGFSIIYSFLIFTIISKYYTDQFYVVFAFIIIFSIGILIGFLISLAINNNFIHIYIELVYPVFTLLPVFFLYRYNSIIPYYFAILLFLPGFIIIGFSLSSGIKFSIKNYQEDKLFNIIIFFLTIFPFPILLSLSYIKFTTFWYFIFFYIIVLINIILPGIFLLNRKEKGYIKFIYIIFSLLFIPGLFLSQIYFKISFKRDLFVTNADNFNMIKQVNFNSEYININETVFFKKRKIFKINDSIIKNIKRSLLTIHLYQPKNESILFLDGNQKFMGHPLLGICNNSYVIDTVPDRVVDFNERPVQEKQLYVPDKEYILNFLKKNSNQFFTVVSIPNILDQNYNDFIFSAEYYKLIKNKIKKGGVFAQLINLDDIKIKSFYNLINNTKSLYKNHRVYYFLDVMIVLSSDGDKTFDIEKNNLVSITKIIKKQRGYNRLFYNKDHLVSHLVYTDINKVLYSRFSPVSRFLPVNFYISIINLRQELLERFLDKKNSKISFKNKIDKKITYLLKDIEIAEYYRNHTVEIKAFKKLKKYYNLDSIRKYLKRIFAYKENYYFEAAKEYEKKEIFKNAEVLYKFITVLNKKNINAFYRLGIVSIKLKKYNAALKCFKKAGKLNKKNKKIKKLNRKVIFNTGIVFYKKNKIKKALKYFLKAQELYYSGDDLFLNIAQSYEKTGKLPEAVEYYKKALIKDANNRFIKEKINSLFKEVKKKL